MIKRLRILGCAALWAAIVPGVAAAQLVTIRTAPVSVSEQFYTFPSRLLGMGGGLALKDLEADPFANPATGARVSGALINGTPTLYSLPRDDGFGRTLPVTVFAGAATTFGAFSFAVQEIEAAARNRFFEPAPGVPRRDRFSHNTYTFGLVGHKWPRQRSALALSASYAKLDALHMVDLLYPNAEAIEQGGHVSDVRIGFLREYTDDRYLEAVLVRNHVDMQHTVTYVDRVWDPVPWNWVAAEPRLEKNEDNSTTWGAHLAYTRPMPESKWRVAGALTANAKQHPHIPNYQFMNIPRDPGHSWAFRIGLGAARVDSVSLLALDVTYEPAWTFTWADAATPVESVSGRVIPIGGVTVENDIVFSNTSVHVGWSRALDKSFGVQLGLSVRRVDYWLDQYSHLTETAREQDEGWTEWTPSWGLTLGFADFQLRYFGHRRGGGLDFGGSETLAVVDSPGGDVDIVAAPGNPLGMDVVPVFVHQLGVSVPIGRKRVE